MDFGQILYKSKREIERIEGNKYFWEGLFVFLVFDTRKGFFTPFSCVEIIMILDTVRQTFLSNIPSVSFYFLQTYQNVFQSYYVFYLFLSNKNYVYYKQKWWTNKRGGENLLSKQNFFNELLKKNLIIIKNSTGPSPSNQTNKEGNPLSSYAFMSTTQFIRLLQG